jgi:tetratricopeptide (TPR) repeat protein
MKFPVLQKCLSALLIGFALCSSALAETDSAFAKGNDQYAQGHFPEAIQLYQELVRSGEWSPTLFYNLGNAYFRNGDFSRSILNYERALALEPRHPEASANLAVARDEARAMEIGRNRLNYVAKFLTVSELAIIAAVAFWIAIFAFAFVVMGQRRSPGLVILAIVTQPNIQARVATADNAKSVLALSGGSEVEVLSQRGDWIYATLPNGLRGWLPSQSVELVRL